MSKSIAHNTAWMTVASVGQKIISFVYFTILARNIGVENTGKYFFALSFTTVFVVFVDLGLNNVLIREGAREKSKLQQYLSSVLFAKIFFGVLSYAAVFLAINWMGYPVETKYLVYLSGVTMLFDSLHLSIYGVLRAMGNLKYEALAVAGSQFLTLILGTTFLYLRLPLIYLIAAFTIPSFINVCYASAVLYWKYRIKLKPRWDKEVMKFFGRIAVPFALAAIFARVYSYADSILLSKLAGDAAVGWYSIPYKITYAFQFIPLALVAALYPKFSEYFANNRQKLALAYGQGIKYLLLVVMPVALGIGVLARPIVLSLYTAEYLNSVLPLQILLAGLVFSYISFPIGAFLNACNRQATQTFIIFCVMVLNIALNLFLIPRYGVIGAAIAALAGNFVLTVWGYAIAPRVTAIPHRFLFKSFGQILLAAGVMGAVVYQVNLWSNYLIAILAGAVVYSAMLFVTRAIDIAQLKEAIHMVRQ
ncbi:MAG: oligosaccharide flippase family protein [Candidatus Magasanikbacteria bacterium]|nr:oligosaccharide flippase family protein [Candidatus Magasanikbacteria bacterium]